MKQLQQDQVAVFALGGLAKSAKTHMRLNIKTRLLLLMQE